MTANDPLTGPFMTSTRITDSSDMPGYATTIDPDEAAPSRARQLREEAMNRWL